MTRYTEFYNRCGMLDDYNGPRLRSLPETQRFDIINEHHRRTEVIAKAYDERGEVIDYHDPRFESTEQSPTERSAHTREQQEEGDG